MFSVSKKSLDAAIKNISGAFIWSDSEEGHDFWSDVVTRLERIRDEGYDIQEEAPEGEAQ